MVVGPSSQAGLVSSRSRCLFEPLEYLDRVAVVTVMELSVIVLLVRSRLYH